MSFRDICGKAYEFFVGLAMAGLTCYPRSVPGWLGLALIFGLLEHSYISIDRWRSYSTWTYVALLIPAAFFLLNLLGLIHTENMDLGTKDVGRKITLILVPIFLLFKGISADRIKKWMTFYLIGVVIALNWNNVHSAVNYFVTGESHHFFGEHGITQMHIGYFALHLLVAIGIVVQRIFKHHLSKRNFAYGLGLLAIYIIFNLILTGSKMGFLTLLTMLGVAFSLMLIRGMGWKRVSIAVLAVIFTMGLIVSQTDYLADRFSRMTVDTPIDPDTIESTQARRMAWICAWERFQETLLIGEGTGDVQSAMMDCYGEKGFRGPASENLGPHSQYLESGIAVGVLGSITVLLMFLIPLVRALRSQHIVSTMFFLSFLMACISESMFERAMGIHLFALGLPLMLAWIEFREEELRAGVKGM
ncbi:MAG: O-antigen ligase family protein [Flavobacteriales bacterium]|nr:O-antigen ligase family protein [Flavobacteriales bacterium]